MLETNSTPPPAPTTATATTAPAATTTAATDSNSDDDYDSDDFGKGVPDLRTHAAKQNEKTRKGSPKVGVDFKKASSVPLRDMLGGIVMHAYARARGGHVCVCS